MDKPELCPCISMRCALASERVLALTATPLAIALLFPSLVTFLEIVKVPSSISKPRSSKLLTLVLGILKRALADNLSSPLLTRVLSDLPPKTRLSAVRTIVLPAPVSPVSTVKPLLNSSAAPVITPIFFICISSKKVLSLTAPTFNWQLEFSYESIGEDG